MSKFEDGRGVTSYKGILGFYGVTGALCETIAAAGIPGSCSVLHHSRQMFGYVGKPGSRSKHASIPSLARQGQLHNIAVIRGRLEVGRHKAATRAHWEISLPCLGSMRQRGVVRAAKRLMGRTNLI